MASADVQPCSLPEDALLQSYRAAGVYTDCFVVELPVAVPFAHYVNGFYTTRLFKLERLILKWAVSKPSSDTQAAQLAAGTLDQFAAWKLEQRAENQLLLTDYLGRTRSWLMTRQLAAQSNIHTRLYFGSAVVPRAQARPNSIPSRQANRALLSFHKIYSRMLLQAAASRIINANTE